MKTDDYKIALYFRDVPAADIQKWFMGSDPSDAVALLTYCGRGIYEGVTEVGRDGYNQYEEFSFELEKDSLSECLEKVEDNRYTELLEKDGDHARVIDLEAVVHYLNANGGAFPVLSDVPHLDELIQTMHRNGIRPEWFAWISVKEGKTVNLVSAEAQDQRASEDVLKEAQSMYDDLNQKFEPLIQAAGYHALDGIILIGVALTGEFTPVHYKGAGKAIYDDLHNTAIIRCELTR